MRIKEISARWFRGAAGGAVLRPEGRSLAVYGPNGAGKSTFVDAVEVCIRGGKVAHLAHEYSGRFQEKGLLATHRPKDESTQVAVHFVSGDACVVCEWARSGGPRFTPENAAPLSGWDYRRTALRQEEMAEFIKAKKSEKYSALLPLLGLGHLETAAENLRKLSRDIAAAARLEALQAEIAALDRLRTELFPGASDEEIAEAKSKLVQAHAPGGDAHGALAAVEASLANSEEAGRRAAALRDLAGAQLEGRIESVRTITAEIALGARPLVEQRLEVLNATADFLIAVPAADHEVGCPACGRSIPVHELKEHVAAERDQLSALNEQLARRAAAVSELCDEVVSVRATLSKRELGNWRSSLSGGDAGAVGFMLQLNPNALREACTEPALAELAANAKHVVDAAAREGGSAPPELQNLLQARERARFFVAEEQAGQKRAQVERAAALMQFVSRLEAGVREEIRAQATAVFDQISGDIQRLWAVLDPLNRVTEVRLYSDADKAIDVALRFHGIDQDSPRLTLSEGARNALGLCIFLAMAKQERGTDRPILLDDVIVSLDRDHRSMVALLLEREFSDRQIILLTHDREWFAELQRMLPRQRWGFAKLLPWRDPETGVRFAQDVSDLAAARAALQDRPEQAEQDARRVMDVELSVIAEKLEVPVPHLRGDANDTRTAGQLLPRITSRAKEKLRRRAGERYEKDAARVGALQAIEPMLTAWANRATHTFSASPSEAVTVLDGCESALAAFVCDSCEQPVWAVRLDSTGERRCGCGELRWDR